MQRKNSLSIGFFIDAENINADLINTHLKFLSPLGKVTVIRAYANWQNNGYQKLYKSLIESGLIERRELLKNGKNGADKTLIREASQLLNEKKVDAIVIYAKDSDYVMAIEAWKGLGGKVVAFNMPGVSPAILENADFVICSRTGAITKREDVSHNEGSEIITRVRCEILRGLKILGSINSDAKRPELNIHPDSSSVAYWRDAIVRILKNAGGKMLVSQLGDAIRKQLPTFNPSNYQCKKLTAFLRKYVPEIQVILSADGLTFWAELKG